MSRIWFTGLFVLLVVILFNQRELDNKYNRPIIGDAKGYYAYLPATFLYQDFTYSFTNEMERKYYLEDGSLGKGFQVEQPNGTSVNKCFPGTSLFYLPFFLFAVVFSWLGGLPVDGYSILFQWSIVAAHFFYFFLALIILNRFLALRGINVRARISSLILVALGTNCYYYLIYDHSVAHIFDFFGLSVLLYLTEKLRITKKTKYIGLLAVTLSVLVITRPTNAMMVLFLPLVYSPRLLYTEILKKVSIKAIPWLWFVVALAILFIAPLLWKIQTGNWLVYSYGDEKLDLLNPNLIDFLFSYKKGWLLWTPIMLFFILLGTIYFFREQIVKGGIYFFGILLIAYVFSSWWIWTYGMGMGQRPMIDFYPILIFGVAGFLNTLKSPKWWLLVFLPLVAINMVQAYQIHRFIMVGGETTKEIYWSHFLQLKTDAPVVAIPNSWEFVRSYEVNDSQELNEGNSFSKAVEFPDYPEHSKFVVQVVIGGENRKANVSIVMTNDSGDWYDAHFPSADIYAEPRAVEYLFEPPANMISPIKCYIWNGDSGDEIKIESVRVSVYKLNRE